MISHEELLRILSYDPETGVFVWLAARKGVRVGQVAGSLASNGYIYVGIDRQKYLAHRLAWFFMTRSWPAQEIDHRNHKPADNRWQNLREATHSQNLMNNTRASRPGMRGVFFDQRPKKRPWVARVRCQGKVAFYGCFATREQAHQAYCEAAKRLHGEFVSSSQVRA